MVAGSSSCTTSLHLDVSDMSVALIDGQWRHHAAKRSINRAAIQRQSHNVKRVRGATTQRLPEPDVPSPDSIFPARQRRQGHVIQIWLNISHCSQN